MALRRTGTVFEALAGKTILESAEAAGVSLSSSCRVGTCRTCMRRLISGGIVYRMEWPGLLAEEKAEGWTLPCVAYPTSNLVMD
jgi:ferredoxin